MKNSFVMYTEYKKHFNLLSDSDKVILLNAIFDYAMGQETELEGAVAMAFSFIKVQMDRDIERYEKTCEKRREAGAKGGLAKASNSKQMLANASKSKQNIASVADNDNDNDNDNDISIKKVAKATRFTKPSVEEIREYCQERNNQVDPQNFFDFYESKVWKVGNQSMKDWKACVRTWESRDKSVKKTDSKFVNFEKRSYDMDELERLLLDN